MAKVKVSKLERPYHSGDWHDAPLKWTVQGPGAEVQDFSRKADAEEYAKLRRRNTAAEASRKFIQGHGWSAPNPI